MFDLNQIAVDLVEFIIALRKINVFNGPLVSQGQPLKTRDQETQKAIFSSKHSYEQIFLLKTWEENLDILQSNKSSRWIYGDLHAGNGLVRNNKITDIVDFGSMGVGDPACDLMAT